MNPTILLVDSDLSNRTDWQSIFEEQGYRVFAAGSAGAALDECAGLQPDLVLLQTTLPDMHGLELCRRLKDDSRNRATPIVLMAPHSNDVDVSQARDAGADDFWGTPSSYWELFNRVQSIIQMKSCIDRQADSVILSLARTIEARDPYTEHHCERLSEYAVQLGKLLKLRDDDKVPVCGRCKQSLALGTAFIPNDELHVVLDGAGDEGEQLVGSGPVAAGDTVRWIIGDTESGIGTTKRIHILVKPTRPDLVSNLVINTDRRTYLLELRSAEKTYMASVSWQYPEDQLIALRRQNASAEAATPIVTGVDISRLRFRYAIEGDNPPWRPVFAFDDGSKVYIEMPAGIAQGEAPPLFVVGPEGDGQLVNYRVRQNYYVVDRLFAAAELRMGGEHQQTVRISRTDGRGR